MGLAPQEAAHGPDIPATASSCSQSTTPIRPGADGAAVHRHQAACPARPAWFAQVLRDGLAWPSPQARRQSQPSPQACRTACTRTTRPTVTATPRTARAGQLRVPADPLQRVGRGPCARRRRPVTLSNGATSVADMLSYCIAASLSGPPRRPSTTRPAAARKSETAQAASAPPDRRRRWPQCACWRSLRRSSPASRSGAAPSGSSRTGRCHHHDRNPPKRRGPGPGPAADGPPVAPQTPVSRYQCRRAARSA